MIFDANWLIRDCKDKYDEIRKFADEYRKVGTSEVYDAFRKKAEPLLLKCIKKARKAANEQQKILEDLYEQEPSEIFETREIGGKNDEGAKMCRNVFKEENTSCDMALRNSILTHQALSETNPSEFQRIYTEKRADYASCLRAALQTYRACTKFAVCDARRKSAKETCDKYLEDGSASLMLSDTRDNYKKMDVCYRNVIKNYWKCHDVMKKSNASNKNWKLSLDKQENTFNLNWSQPINIETKIRNVKKF